MYESSIEVWINCKIVKLASALGGAYDVNMESTTHYSVNFLLSASDFFRKIHKAQWAKTSRANDIIDHIFIWSSYTHMYKGVADIT